ncbi:hypothetical protein ACNISN_23310, partial [Escherichia coli]|uniref:hypothetical protein n=1 Tax=Escherichia coli TaxID=562 RepID=UPI001BFDA97B
KRAYCLKTQPATGETYPKSDLFNKAALTIRVAVIINHKIKRLHLENSASSPKIKKDTTR